MKKTDLPVTAVEITDVSGLDAIQVLWINLAPGRGHVMITCWGCAWTAYFGGMCNHTIQEFFQTADTRYLVSKLICREWQKQTKRHEAYLAKIVDAVKAALAEEQDAERKG